MIHIALLRGINVGGHRLVAMSDLRALLTQLGFDDPRSLLQSGNLVFRSDKRTGPALERLLEAATEKALGHRIDFFVRTAKEWQAVVDRNPFQKEAERDPARLLVMFLKDIPEEKDVRALQTAIVGSETVHTTGRQAYVVYPDGIGRSRVTHSFIEGKLRTRGTGRNWNTILKLAALAKN